MDRSPTTTKIIKDAIRRFYHLPARTIARYVLAAHGDYFDNDLEKIRSRIRKQLGKHGELKRQKTVDKSLFRSGAPKIPKTWRKKRTPYKLSPGLWLILSDLHVPYHEKLPIEAAIQEGKAEKVNGIFFNGDLQDCASIGFWFKEKRDFAREIEDVVDFLDFFRHEFPKQKIVYKPGNHEYRLPRLFASKVPELIGTPLAAMETLLGLEERNIEFLDYHQIVYAGLLPIIHGHEIQNISRTVNPARGLYLRAKTFSACSHCHSTSEHTPKTIEGKLLTTWSFGCLCDLEPDWNPYGNDWNWGYGLINIEKDGDFEVVNRRILPDGRVR